MVTLQNYEEHMMLYVDEELNTAEVNELLEFIKLHPELEAEFEAYKKTKLPAATELIYPDKTTLLKQTTKTITLNRWLVYGVAAGIALLLTLAIGKWATNPTNVIIETPEVAKKTEPAIAPANPVIPINPQIKQESQPAPVNPVNHTASIAKVRHDKPTTTVKKSVTPVNPSTQRPTTTIDPIIYEKQESQIVKTDAEDDRPTAAETVAHPEEIQQPEERKRARRNFLALLPISSEKKQGLQHLKNTVEEKVDAVKTINNNLKNTSLELKLGNKELFVINL